MEPLTLIADEFEHADRISTGVPPILDARIFGTSSVLMLKVAYRAMMRPEPLP